MDQFFFFFSSTKMVELVMQAPELFTWLEEVNPQWVSQYESTLYITWIKKAATCYYELESKETKNLALVCGCLLFFWKYLALDEDVWDHPDFALTIPNILHFYPELSEQDIQMAELRVFAHVFQSRKKRKKTKLVAMDTN